MTEGNTKRDRKRKPGFLFVCLFVCIIWIMWWAVCVCVCVYVQVFVCACLHAHAWIAYLPRFSWLQTLVLGTRPDCPSVNITGPKITFSTFWNSQIHRHTKLQETMLVVRCQCSPKCCWHTLCLYTHSTFFHRLSYQFNQEMKNKHNFCTAVFVFDKWFIWWEVWSRPCLQYLFQAAADSSRGLAEYL